MPFTFAHPAAAVPFSKWGLVLSALIVGSMAPDFAYFACLPIDRSFVESLHGLVLFCLPAGWIVLWLFHAVLKRPLLCLLPREQAKRLGSAAGPFGWRPAARFALIVVSLLAGSATHIAWDAFTNPKGWGVDRFPILQCTPIGAWGEYGRVHHVLHAVSSAGGVALLWVWSRRWLRRARPVAGTPPLVLPPVLKAGLVLAMLLLAGALSAGHAAHAVSRIRDYHVLRVWLRHAVTRAVPVLFLELLMFGGVVRAVLWRRGIARHATLHMPPV